MQSQQKQGFIIAENVFVVCLCFLPQECRVQFFCFWLVVFARKNANFCGVVASTDYSLPIQQQYLVVWYRSTTVVVTYRHLITIFVQNAYRYMPLATYHCCVLTCSKGCRCELDTDAEMRNARQNRQHHHIRASQSTLLGARDCHFLF